MKITVNIDDQELIEAAKEVAIRRIADDIFSDYRAGYCYKQVIKDCVREAIKKDIDGLSERAVAAAAKTIENRAIKKMFDKVLTEADKEG